MRKPFGCSGCGRSFAAKEGVLQHIQDAHCGVGNAVKHKRQASSALKWPKAFIRLKIVGWLCPTTHRVVPHAPTSGMLKAACKAMSPESREGLPWVGSREKHKIRYQSMLDANQRFKEQTNV